MATKKEKRRILAERRAKEDEERRQSGLKAQLADRQKRAAEARKEWQETHDNKHHKFIDECPICSDIKRANMATKAAVSA